MNITIARQIAKFLIVGLLTVTIYFLTRQMLWQIIPYVISSPESTIGFYLVLVLSSIVCTIFAYLFNCFWTFNQPNIRTRSAVRFLLLCLLNFGVWITANDVSASLQKHILHPELIFAFVFLLTTGISATLSFIGMKFFVFTGQDQRSR